MSTDPTLATTGRRAWAALIDSLVVSVFVLIVFYDPLMALAQIAEGAVTPQKQAEFLEAFRAFEYQILPYMFALYVIYHAVLVWQWSGMTLGKYLMRIRVVQADTGAPVSFGTALVRALGRTVGEMFLMYATFVPAFFASSRQTLHDRLARTIVVAAPQERRR